MSWVAVGLGAGGLVLGGVGGWLGSDTESVKKHELPSQFYNPNSDPLLSALSLNALTGIGSFDANVYRQASPFQQFISQIGSTGNLDKRQMREVQSAAMLTPEELSTAQSLTGKKLNEYLRSRGYSKFERKNIAPGLKRLPVLATAAGYGSVEELLQEDSEYKSRMGSIEEQVSPVSEKMREGILASQERYAGYLKDLPNLLAGDANPFIDKLTEQALTSANKYGYNPYKGLETARSDALSRALQLIMGENAAVQALQSAALPVASLRQQGGATAAQIGAGQAQTMAQIAQFNAQQKTQQNQNLGDTIGSLGNALMIGGLLSGKGSGPGTGSDDSSDQASQSQVSSGWYGGERW